MNHNHRYAGVGNQPIIYCSYKKTNERIAELEKQRDGLVAENSALKSSLQVAFDEMESHHDTDGLFSTDADGEPMDALIRLCDAQGEIEKIIKAENPATDAAIAEIGARAVDGFAKFYAEESQYLEPELMECAKVYANKLRGGGV
ncbi:hypothetical protein QT13_01710 [Pectobacterium brasiliense]|uniref:hypothetical protein n=1 Tax=Pectobacterium brasiliense TaxID=180957 RepID=UPI00057C7DB3|nr:hypothetical protein [Pectobacterium brasiliense]KHS76983.1 hypothetical protein QT13_01710 [Pectobacterium brasiliense]